MSSKTPKGLSIGGVTVAFANQAKISFQNMTPMQQQVIVQAKIGGCCDGLTDIGWAPDNVPTISLNKVYRTSLVVKEPNLSVADMHIYAASAANYQWRYAVFGSSPLEIKVGDCWISWSPLDNIETANKLANDANLAVTIEQKIIEIYNAEVSVTDRYKDSQNYPKVFCRTVVRAAVRIWHQRHGKD